MANNDSTICDEICIVEGDSNPVGISKGTIYSITDEEHDRSKCLGKVVTGDFEPYPNTSKERECIYISGPSGAGKSYLAAKYMTRYKEVYPENKIILFSNKPMEHNSPKYLHLKVTENLFSKLDLDNYKNSLVIFDDVENIVSEKALQNKLMRLMEEMLNVGRSKRITVIIISHVMMNYRFTKNIILECNKVVMFPRSGSRHQYVNFMKTYLGFDSNKIDDILTTKSRWLVLDKEFPMNILTTDKLEII